MMIRPEREADRHVIHEIVAAAFGGLSEADLVDALRADGDLVLSLLAEEDGAIVGHVGFSRLRVVSEEGGEFAALSLAPLAVRPDRQRRGIGGALVRAGHEALRERGEHLSIVVGDPAYYTRFGYDRERAVRFASRYQCDALLALAFGPAPDTGTLVYPPAFERL